MLETDEAADRGRLHFLLDVAHMLRTPAGVIAGYVEMLRDGDVTLEDALPALESQSTELRNTLDRMLEAASTALGDDAELRDRLRVAREDNRRLLETTQRLLAESKRVVAGAGSGGRPPGS